jgi:hypothetical protein
MDRYEVVVVRYSEPARLTNWRDVPTQYVETGTPLRNLVWPLTATWVRAFNQAELARHYGVWAVMRPQRNAGAA